MLKRLLQIAGGVVALAIVLLVALYVFHPASGQVRDSAIARTPARTMYPSIVPDATRTPEAGPDLRPLVIDLATGRVTPIDIPDEYGVRRILMDGTLLLDSGTGSAPIYGRDGTKLVDLPVPPGERAALTRDGRYAIWIEDEHLQVYDAASHSYGPAPPPAGETYEDVPQAVELSDGTMLLTGDTRNVAGGQRAGIAIIEASGTVTGMLPSSDGEEISVAPDGRAFAWAQPHGIHIRTVASGEERVLSDVESASGSLIWSPDSQRIAYQRFTREGAATPCAQIAPGCHPGIWLVELGTGDERLVYQAPEGRRIEGLRFVDAHTIEYRMLPEELERYSGSLPGTRYRVADDGGTPQEVDVTADAWNTCGPRCGLPPPGYEDADGLARWVALRPGGQDEIHLAYIDRVRATARDLDSSTGFVSASLSPQRSYLAVVHPGGGELVLKMTSVADASTRDVRVGHSPLVAWFPDGASVLVYGCCSP